MENSLEKLFETDLGNSEKKPSGPDSLDCIPMSQRALFMDPYSVPGGITKPMTALILIIAITTICINLGVILRIKKLLKRLGDPKPAFFFIGNLAVSDFLVGFYVTTVLCIDLTLFTSEWRNRCCGFLTAVVVTACQETICTITLIALDKYIFICHGLSYRRIVTQRRVWIAIIASWCGSLIIGFLPWFGLREKDWCVCSFLLYINKTFSIVLLITAVLLPLVSITFMYSVILSLAIKVTKRKTSKKLINRSSRFRLSLKSSKSSARTLISKISNTDSVIVHQSAFIPQSGERGRVFQESPKTRRGNSKFTDEAESIESIRLNDNSPLTILGHKTSSLPTVVELQETELTIPHETDSSEECVDGAYLANKNSSRPFEEDLEQIKRNPLRRDSYEFANSSSVLSDWIITTEPLTNESRSQESEEYVENETALPGSPSNGKAKSENNGETKRERKNYTEEDLNSENDESKVEDNRKTPKGYYRKIIAETRDKVEFLKKCRAIKAIFLIVFCFVVTYVPFVTGTFSFKIQNEYDESLFKALNNLLYFAVVLNSLMNPFVYAYGYKEFRLRTKNFKGIFARERKRNKK